MLPALHAAPAELVRAKNTRGLRTVLGETPRAHRPARRGIRGDQHCAGSGCSNYCKCQNTSSPFEPPSNAEATGEVGEDCLSPRAWRAGEFRSRLSLRVTQGIPKGRFSGAAFFGPPFLAAQERWVVAGLPPANRRHNRRQTGNPAPKLRTTRVEVSNPSPGQQHQPVVPPAPSA